MTDIDADAADCADMEALAGGEDLALNRIMGRHREKMFHYLIRVLGDEAEAVDVAQETFVRVFLNRAKFNTKHRFSSWMYAIATNLARDRMRWLGRRKNISLDAPLGESGGKLAESLADDKPAPVEGLEGAERAEEVQRALAEVPQDLREALVLVEYEDMSQAEAAEVLRCTPKAVENRLYRGRKLLREKLGHLLRRD